MRQPILEPTDQEIDMTQNVYHSLQEPSTESISSSKSQRLNVDKIQNFLKPCEDGSTYAPTFSELVPPQTNRYISLPIQQSENNKGIRMIRPCPWHCKTKSAYAKLDDLL